MYITLLYTLIVILITRFHISGLLWPRHLVLGCYDCRLTYFRLFRTSEQDLSQKIDYSEQVNSMAYPRTSHKNYLSVLNRTRNKRHRFHERKTLKRTMKIPEINIGFLKKKLSLQMRL